MEIQTMERAVEILLVEDNPADVRLTIEALKETKVANHVNYVLSGEDAMAYLKKQGKYTDAVRPDIILLDLKLAKLTGFDVLKLIRANKPTAQVPVVIFTSSNMQADMLEGYKVGANSIIMALPFLTGKRLKSDQNM